MIRASIRRRAAAPLALFAAIALAAGGGSSPWFGRSSPASHPAGPSAVHLEHAELVALRAQNAPLTYRSIGP